MPRGVRSRWRQMLRAPDINRVVRDSGSIDVHVISPPRSAGELPKPPRRHRPASVSPRRRAAGWVLGTVGIALLSLALSPLQPAFGLPGALLCLLLGVVAVATVGGVPPAVAATLVAALGADYFFTPPIHSLQIRRAADAVALAMFFAVAASVSALVDQLTRRSIEMTRARAESEALAQANGLRKALLAAVSHDLRTPLHSIKTAATSVLSDEVKWSPEQVSEFCATIDTETDRLTTLVDNLLDMRRLETGAQPISVHATAVEDVLQAMIADLSTGGPSIVLDVAEALPAVVADPGLLERALANVLANAREWAPPGAPVRVQAALSDGHVEIRVIDRGPGVAPDRRGQLFKPFQRLGDRASANHNGLGLGLAIAKGLVEAMGGELTLQDTLGGGATFVFSLPIVEPQTATTDQAVSVPDGASPGAAP